jgi:transcriptional regulator with XRE-family HTH domain
MSPIGEQLRRLRETRGESVESVAARARLTSVQVEAIEDGAATWETAVKYAAAFRHTIRVNKGRRLRETSIASLAEETGLALNTVKDALAHVQLPRPAFVSPFNPRVDSVERLLEALNGGLELV